jgi:lipoprotein-releasing system permease protein
MMVQSEHKSRRLNVCGIFNTGFSDFDKQLGIVDLRLIQVLNYWTPNMVGSYEIQVERPDAMEQNLEQVQEYLGYNYNTRTVRDIYSSIFAWLEKLDINGVIVVLLMILVATINMITALLILIIERANMVGLVKVFGMTNVSVRGIFLRIAARLVLRGMVWGNVVGIGLCLLQYYFHLAKLDASTYYVAYVAIYFNWEYILILNVGTLLVCGLMLILPTLILTKMTPIKTLKLD